MTPDLVRNGTRSSQLMEYFDGSVEESLRPTARISIFYRARPIMKHMLVIK